MGILSSWGGRAARETREEERIAAIRSRKGGGVVGKVASMAGGAGGVVGAAGLGYEAGDGFAEIKEMLQLIKTLVSCLVSPAQAKDEFESLKAQGEKTSVGNVEAAKAGARPEEERRGGEKKASERGRGAADASGPAFEADAGAKSGGGKRTVGLSAAFESARVMTPETLREASGLERTFRPDKLWTGVDVSGVAPTDLSGAYRAARTMYEKNGAALPIGSAVALSWRDGAGTEHAATVLAGGADGGFFVPKDGMGDSYRSVQAAPLTAEQQEGFLGKLRIGAPDKEITNTLGAYVAPDSGASIMPAGVVVSGLSPGARKDLAASFASFDHEGGWGAILGRTDNLALNAGVGVDSSRVSATLVDGGQGALMLGFAAPDGKEARFISSTAGSLAEYSRSEETKAGAMERIATIGGVDGLSIGPAGMRLSENGAAGLAAAASFATEKDRLTEVAAEGPKWDAATSRTLFSSDGRAVGQSFSFTRQKDGEPGQAGMIVAANGGMVFASGDRQVFVPDSLVRVGTDGVSIGAEHEVVDRFVADPAATLSELERSNNVVSRASDRSAGGPAEEYSMADSIAALARDPRKSAVSPAAAARIVGLDKGEIER